MEEGQGVRAGGEEVPGVRKIYYFNNKIPKFSGAFGAWSLLHFTEGSNSVRVNSSECMGGPTNLPSAPLFVNPHQVRMRHLPTDLLPSPLVICYWVTVWTGGGGRGVVWPNLGIKTSLTRNIWELSPMK